MDDLNVDLLKMFASMSSQDLPKPPRQGGNTEEHEVSGWESNIAPGEHYHGLYRTNAEGAEKIISEAIEVTEVIEADEVAVGLTARITFPDGRKRERFVPVDVVVTRDVAGALLESTGVAWTPDVASDVRQWVAAALRAVGVPRQRGIERPRWDGETLIVPGPDLRIIPRSGASFLSAYGRTSDDESKARDDWRYALSAACANPKLAIVMGAAAISPYLEKLNQRAFVQHTYADSRMGKTTAMEIAMAAFGDPADVARTTWNTTPNAALARMEGANILPVALDETGAAGAFKDELIAKVVFGAASGQGRGRARAGGGLRDDVHWRLVMLSTGEARLTTSTGLSGTRARVLELEAPITDSRHEIEDVHAMVTGSFGWPLVWMASNPRATEAIDDLETLTRAIVTSEDSMTRTVEGLVAVAGAGFRALGRACDCEDFITMDTTIEIAEAVAKKQRGQLRAEGISAADRLYDALMERVNRRPWAFPAREKDVEAGREREGATMTEGIAFFAKAVADVAKDIKLDDPMPALRGLAKDGRLVLPESADRDSRLTRVTRVANKSAKVYLIAPEGVTDSTRAGNGVTHG